MHQARREVILKTSQEVGISASSAGMRPRECHVQMNARLLSPAVLLLDRDEACFSLLQRDRHLLSSTSYLLCLPAGIDLLELKLASTISFTRPSQP